MTDFPVFCGKDCGGNACPMLATVEDGRVTHIRHNPVAGDFLRACQRGYRLHEETYAPDRLLHPLIRVGPRGSGEFRQAGWDEALDLTAARLSDIRERFGPQAVLNRGSAGVTGSLHATYALLTRFLHLFGGCTRLTANYSNAAAGFILPYVLGDTWGQSGFDAATMRDAQMIILWGTNLLETRHGVDVPQYLLEARQRGAEIVVIDPRRTATARRVATWWLPCRPGTDAALMLAVLYVLISENLVQREFIAAHSVGFEQLERYVMGLDGEEARSPAWAANICGLPADEITRFARAYASAKPAMLFPGFSIQRVFAGEESFRLTVALQVATGNFGVRGGSTGSMNNSLPGPRVGKLPVPPLPGLPHVPVSRWPDAVLTGRAGGYPSDLHAIYNLGSNLINQGSDIHKSIAAFEKLDFAVTHELFMTPTARYCDVVFPAASALEKTDIGFPWVGNFVLYKPQILPPPGEARSDYAILWALAERMGFGEAFSEGRSQEDWIEYFIANSEISDVTAFKRSGIYFGAEQERVGMADFAADPLAHPLATPSGKVEIGSARYQRETGFAAIPTWQPAPSDPRFPLSLVTPKTPHRTHSQGGRLTDARQRAPHALEMHPADAAARMIQDGQRVRIFNARGEACLPVHLSDDLAPGVVSLFQGVWVELDANGVDQAGSANMFTDTSGTTASVACIMHAIAVQVE